MVLAGGLTPENVGEAIERTHPYAVDVVSGVEAEPGRKDPAKVEAFFEAIPSESRGGGRLMPAVEERFGPYGGRFVPETLIAALDELERRLGRGARGRGLPGGARARSCATSSGARPRSTSPSASPSESGAASI